MWWRKWKKVEKYILLYSVALVLMALLLGLASCGMVINKPTRYKGKSDASKPYVEMGKMDTLIHSCDSWTQTCEASIGVNPHIHNPTKYLIKGQVVCQFTATDVEGNEQVQTKKSVKPIVLGPRGSKAASVRIYSGTSFTVSTRTDITASCWLRYIIYEPTEILVE